MTLSNAPPGSPQARHASALDSLRARFAARSADAAAAAGPPPSSTMAPSSTAAGPAVLDGVGVRSPSSDVIPRSSPGGE